MQNPKYQRMDERIYDLDAMERLRDYVDGRIKDHFGTPVVVKDDPYLEVVKTHKGDFDLWIHPVNRNPFPFKFDVSFDDAAEFLLGRPISFT